MCQIFVIVTAAEATGHCFNHDNRDSVTTAVTVNSPQQEIFNVMQAQEKHDRRSL